jgi:hypothetical protein
MEINIINPMLEYLPKQNVSETLCRLKATHPKIPISRGEWLFGTKALLP